MNMASFLLTLMCLGEAKNLGFAQCGWGHAYMNAIGWMLNRTVDSCTIIRRVRNVRYWVLGLGCWFKMKLVTKGILNTQFTQVR